MAPGKLARPSMQSRNIRPKSWVGDLVFLDILPGRTLKEAAKSTMKKRQNC